MKSDTRIPFSFPHGRQQQIVLAGLLFLFILALTPGLPGFIWDVQCWKNWSTHNGKWGLRRAYESGTDYLPLFQYVLWAFAKVAGSPEAIEKYIGYLRAVMLAADYWALYLAYRWIDRRVDYIYLLLCSMLNVAYTYDTVIWGQVDVLFTALIFASLYFQYRSRPVLSAVIMVLALNAKLQAIVFFPLWGLLMISLLHRERKWKSVMLIIPAMLLTQVLILLPFMSGKGGLMAIWNVVFKAVGIFPYVSLNACNMWQWCLHDLPNGGPDNIRTPVGLTYMQIGLYSFFAASFVALAPLLRHNWFVLSGRTKAPFPKDKIWLTAALIATAFYFFNTQMHERYVYPAFIFITAYAFYSGRYIMYVLFSLAFFLSLERVLCWLQLPNYGTLVFMPEFLAVLFAIVLIWLGVLLYRRKESSVPRDAYAGR